MNINSIGTHVTWRPLKYLQVLKISLHIFLNLFNIEGFVWLKALCAGIQQDMPWSFFSLGKSLTFLSTLSSYNVTLQHIPGKENVSSDFISHNPQSCCEDSCQISEFVYKTINSVVSSVSVTDVVSGSASLPFLSKAAWRSAQHNCPNLRRAFAHLKHGTRPSRKAKNLKHLGHYLGVVTLDEQGLIIVNKEDHFAIRRSLIVVPHKLLSSIATVIDLYTRHSSKHQLKLVFNHRFFSINSNVIINQVVDQCSQCNALNFLPKEVFDQSSSLASNFRGDVFLTDILHRNCQNICVTTDVHSSFTTAEFIENETTQSMRDVLLVTTSHLRFPTCFIRIDSATGFQTLDNDVSQHSYRITLDFGFVKNKNSNSVVDKAMQELELEFLKEKASARAITNI